MMASVALLVTVIAVGGIVMSLNLRLALNDAREKEADAVAAAAEANTARRKARLNEAEALVGQAHGIRNSRRPRQRFDALAALKKAAAIGRELDQPRKWFDRLRHEAIAALPLPDIHITPSWPGWPSCTYDADV